MLGHLPLIHYHSHTSALDWDVIWQIRLPGVVLAGLVGAMLAGGSVVAFLLSRTVGLFGFSERGWQPSPHAVVDLVAELLIVGLWAAYLVIGRRARG